MPRLRSSYVCTACGAVSARWAGRCEACGEWNTIEEEAGRAGEAAPNVSIAGGGSVTGGRRLTFTSLEGGTEDTPRRITGIAELDRVLGSGLVPGSVVLVGGDPGIGKSTLLLQACARLAQKSGRTAYISGEEAEAQVRLRAARLGLEKAPVRLAAATNLRDILTSIETEKPDVVVIDSIQTMWSDALESAPGTVAQLRACVHDLVRFAKRRGTSVILVGHVTKDGQIAGPRVIEHMVDTVLYFEGERSVHFRILRAVKNRYGPTDEIGVFEMTGTGLAEVANPSELFLGERDGGAAGACVFAGIEGTRPVLVEIQALVAPTHFGTPRRAVVGWDAGRLAMVIAVLDARCGLTLGTHDVYLNVAGGLRITEPAADLAVSAALTSALLGIALPRETVVFGEVSLSGAIRPVPQADTRLKEAAKLGFRHAIAPAPPSAKAGGTRATAPLPLTPVTALQDVSTLVREGLPN